MSLLEGSKTYLTRVVENDATKRGSNSASSTSRANSHVSPAARARLR